MKTPHRLLAALVLALAPFAAAQAQTYPSKPIRVLVPYVPGGATDYAARLVTEKVRQTLGQTFVIENKAGAGGIIAIEEWRAPSRTAIR
jgi:tripartite-type tricarboxylate transporter receptor subunit TctC